MSDQETKVCPNCGEPMTYVRVPDETMELIDYGWECQECDEYIHHWSQWMDDMFGADEDD